ESSELGDRAGRERVRRFLVMRRQLAAVRHRIHDNPPLSRSRKSAPLGRGAGGVPQFPPLGRVGGKHCIANTERRNTTFGGTRRARAVLIRSAYSKIDDTTSSILRCTSRSSVSAHTTATWHARRAGIPSWISRPA